MERKYLFGVIGLVLGFAVAYYTTRSYNQANAGAPPAGTTSTAASGGASSTGQQKAVMGDIAEKIEKAKNNPKDFNAQIEAAMTFDQIGRVQGTVEYLAKAYDADSKKFAEMDGQTNASQFIGQ